MTKGLNPGIFRFNASGNFLGDFGTDYPVGGTDILFTPSGNFFVGSDSGDSFRGYQGANTLTERTSTGALIQNFAPATQTIQLGPDSIPGGILYFDLAADLHTMYYTSTGNQIKRFDIASNTQLSDFTTLPDEETTGIHFLPDGSLLAVGALGSNSGIVYRVNAAGDVVQTYLQGSSLLGDVALDQDGTSFWAADSFVGGSGLVENIDIASGAVLNSFHLPVDFGNTAEVTGISVFGESIISNPLNPSPNNPSPISAVPEPSTYGIFGVAGLAGLAYSRIRKNRAARQ